MKLSFGLIIILIFSCISAHSQKDFAKWVNPFVGTAAHGHTFPGATVPFGMVQLSPDTRIDGSWDGCSGYHYSDSMIYGFSHTHLSGTGVSDYGDIMLMPMTGNKSFNNKEYASSFSHQNEEASPGYYSVKLNNGIKVELTATLRTGFHQYFFPEGKSYVVLDLTHRDKLKEGNIEIINNKTIAIRRISEAWAREQHAYAYINFSSSFTYEFNAEKNKIIFHFDDLKGRPLLIKAGYSLTGEKGAELNLKAEISGWSFEDVKLAARNAWNKELGKIEVSDKDKEKLRTFYTALYHVMIHPNVAMDVDGSYRGMDNKIHKAEGFTYYTVFSLWDTFRATHPLFTIIDRKRTSDFIRTFLLMYSQGGRLPVWELASNETDCMIGYHSVSVIADAYMKGIRDFDASLALEAMKKSATWNHLGLPAYMKHGFLSVEDESESVSKTLEYAYDDWCIAQMAKALGRQEDYLNYMERSEGWRNLMDPETKLMRPRKNGNWLSPFDPREVNSHFTEGNSWQYSFFVPQNINGLIDETGGKAAFEALLDSLFNAPSKTTGRDQADITGLIGQYAHGNEPSHHIAYLYNYVDRPLKTKAKVHQVMREFYSSAPDGLIGNEDCGQMSAWYVMSALGIYAVTPGYPAYTITTPYLNSYRVNLENGESFTEKKINRELKKGHSISHDFLTGASSSNIITAMDASREYVRSPIIEGPESFVEKEKIKLSAPGAAAIKYRLEDGSGVRNETWNGAELSINSNSTIEAYAVGKTGIKSKPSKARFYRNPHPHWTVELNCKYNPQYSAGGPAGIIDGIRGQEDWRKGNWQGYQGQDFEAVVDMKEIRRINDFSAGFLQDTRSWILMPVKVEFYVSQDGKHFTKAAEIRNEWVKPEDYTVQIRDFRIKVHGISFDARFVKVKAYNFGKLPEWHLGAGFDAFIFTDELEFR